MAAASRKACVPAEEDRVRVYASRRQRPMITTYSPIIAITPNAITYSIFVYLICFTEETRRPQRRVPASGFQGNLRTDGPTDRTGDRGPRSCDQYSLRSLLEYDAHCRPADLHCVETNSRP